jgi:hypothetical protein
MATSSPRTKKIRSQPPDVIVAVGSKNNMQEFNCYATILSYASEYFDKMLATNMTESNNKRINFPDKDPEDWKEFYKYIDPTKIGTAKRELETLSVRNAMRLSSWFHEFQMGSHKRECDAVLSKEVNTIARRGPHFNEFWDVKKLKVLLT